jgi:thiol-disulfide isomerase/thioredoxin
MPRYSVPTIILLALCAWSASSGSSGPGVGSMAPDFKGRNLVTGERIPLSSQRGKVVIVTFWASWCGPCRRELPVLEKAQEFVGKDKLTVFAVSYHENQDAERQIQKLASSWQINVIEDSNGWIANHYAISGIPHLFIIGRDGIILASHVGYGDRSVEELVADINQALAGTAPVEPPTAISGST